MSELLPVIPSRGDLDWCWYLRRQGQIGEALERVLHDIGVMHPGGWADWQPSTMTDTGAPVEMHFTANQSVISLRTEVEDPGKHPGSRTAKVCDLITELGGGAPPVALRDVIGAIQGAADLRFGAWLGLHHCARKLGMTLFAELPANGLELMGLFPATQIMATLEKFGDGIRPTMLGYHSFSGQTTLYFETDLAPQDVIQDLVIPSGVSPVPLLRNIGGMLDNAGAVNAGLMKKLGFSYTIHTDGSLPTLALQISAKDVFGSDAVIGQLVRDFPGDHVAAYAGLADQLFPAPAGKSFHGDVGLQARGDDSPLFSIGVAAPWNCPFDTI